jgi:RimJ/RimL family protein N-acetyltransferase
VIQLKTERLLLRPWRESDLEPVAEITSDPEVMRFFHLTRTRAQSDAWVARTQAHIDRHGFGVWAVEAPGVADLIGFVGLVHVPDDVPCAPAIEAAWTFGARWWRQGYCTEAAAAAMRDGFERMGFPEIVAFTAASNEPSQGVMRKLGMTRDIDGDFDHPRVPMGHALARHVLYRRLRPQEIAA